VNGRSWSLLLLVLGIAGGAWGAPDDAARDGTVKVDAANDQATEAVKPPKSASAKSKSPADRSAAGKRSTMPEFTPEREAAALTFVRQHHPELARILPALKDRQGGEYKRAIRELFRTSERLAQLRQRNPERYEIELKLWKLHSRVQVLAAKVQMNPNAKVEKELRQALDAYTQARLERLTQEREKLQSRIDTIDSRMEQVRRDHERQVDQQIRSLLESAEKGPRKPGRKGRDEKTAPIKAGDSNDQ